MFMRALLLATILLPAPLAAAKADPSLVSAGKLTYGTAASFAPFEYQDNGQFTGFDIDFGNAIAKEMGLAPAPLNIDFGGLIPALQGKRVDIINSAMYMNPTRAAVVDFIPYMNIGDSIIVAKGNPLNIHSRADVCGHRIAVTLGAIEETYAREDVVNCKKAGKPAPQVMTLPTGQDSALSLGQHRADLEYDSTPGALELIAARPGVYEIAGAPFAENTTIGIAVRKGDTAMQTAVSDAVHKLVADGTYAALLKKYNLPASGSIF